MEKPILPSPISLEEHRQIKREKERVENLNKMSLTEITGLIHEGKLSESDISEIESLTINEKYLLELMILEIEESRFQKDTADSLQEHVRRLEEYIEFLQEEMQGLSKDAIGREETIEELRKLTDMSSAKH